MISLIGQDILLGDRFVHEADCSIQIRIKMTFEKNKEKKLKN